MLAGQFERGKDPKGSAVDGSTKKVLWCPFMSGQLIPKKCDGKDCVFWKVVRSANDKRVVVSGCGFALANDAMIALAGMLKGRE